MNSDFYNKEGYKDPTPYYAMKNRKRVRDTVEFLKEIALSEGFEITNRIELRDIYTGEIYK